MAVDAIGAMDALFITLNARAANQADILPVVVLGHVRADNGFDFGEPTTENVFFFHTQGFSICHIASQEFALRVFIKHRIGNGVDQGVHKLQIIQ